MRLFAPAALGLVALLAFLFEGIAFASRAAERSPTCRGEESLDCGANIVVAAAVATFMSGIAGLGTGAAARLYLDERRRQAARAALVVLALLALVHLLLLHL